MSKRENLLAIDYVKGASSGGTSRVIGSSGTVDTNNFLLRDGTRYMLANFDMGGFSITNVNLVDGVDVFAHTANPNAHHARQHDLDSASDHTGTLSWSSVNKSGSNLTDIVTRTHNSLQSIGENDHHNRQHVITSASDHTVTGNAFDLVGLIGGNTLGILTPSSDVGSGTEAILKSTSAGNLRLASLSSVLLNTTSSANMTIAPAGDLILDPVGNDVLPQTNYDINLGMLSKKYLTLHAAELWVETLVAQETIATIGGRILVGPTTYLTRDIGTGDTTIYVRHNQMISGDRVYMEADGKVEFFAITSGATTISATEFSYTCTRNLDGTGANVWYAGDAMFNTGQTGNGFIDLYSLRGVKTASQAGPTIVGNVRNSSTFNDWSEVWAIGNLNGLYGYGATTYGVGLGKYASGQPNVVIDSTNGVRLRQYTTDMIVLDPSGNSYFAGVMTLGTSGEIRQGTGTLGSNYTGLRIWRDSSVGRIGGYTSNVLQWYGDTSGNLVAGTGNVILNSDGISVASYHDSRTSTPEPGYSEPISTPTAYLTYKNSDAGEAWFSAVDGWFTYNGGTTGRFFGSSRHAVDSGQFASQWSHYIDTVLETTSVTKPAGDTGTWLERLWLKAPNTYIVLVNGNVGIGRTSPEAKLDVNDGNIYISHSTPGTVATPTGGYLVWNSASYGGVSARIRSTDSLTESFAQALTFETRNWDSGFALVERMRLNATGLGIGTTSPGARLDVLGATQDAIQTVEKVGATNSSSQVKSFLLRVRADNSDPLILYRTDASAGNDPKLGFSVGSDTPALTIISGGNVGVGTTSPGSALDVRTGIIRVGNTSDLYSAKIQTTGNIHAQGAITSELYLQIGANSAPVGILGFARIYLESLGSNRYRLRCIMRNEYDTASVDTVIAQNY